MLLGRALFRNLKPLVSTINNLTGSKVKRDDCALLYENQSKLLEYLPEFFTWLNEQIKSGNQQFILGNIQNESNKKDSDSQKKLIFLLVELLEQYSDYSGVAVSTIHEALKQALSINHIYTIEKDNQIIEVSPCLYPLYYNLCSLLFK